MDWSALIIGLGGLALGGFTVYLTYRSRTSAYRERLYLKQMEGFEVVVQALTDLYVVAQNHIASQGCILNDSTRPNLREATLLPNQAFHSAHQRWAIFFPAEVNESLREFVNLLNGISSPVDIARQYPSDVVYSTDPGGLLGDAYGKVVKTVRRGLGVEPLSAETLKLLGTP